MLADHMACSGNAFSYVVQQQRQIEQFGLFEFLENLAVTLIPFGLRLGARCRLSIARNECSSTVNR